MIKQRTWQVVHIVLQLSTVCGSGRQQSGNFICTASTRLDAHLLSARNSMFGQEVVKYDVTQLESCLSISPIPLAGNALCAYRHGYLFPICNTLIYNAMIRVNGHPYPSSSFWQADMAGQGPQVAWKCQKDFDGCTHKLCSIFTIWYDFYQVYSQNSSETDI